MLYYTYAPVPVLAANSALRLAVVVDIRVTLARGLLDFSERLARLAALAALVTVEQHGRRRARRPAPPPLPSSPHSPPLRDTSRAGASLPPQFALHAHPPESTPLRARAADTGPRRPAGGTNNNAGQLALRAVLGLLPLGLSPLLLSALSALVGSAASNAAAVLASQVVGLLPQDTVTRVLEEIRLHADAVREVIGDEIRRTFQVGSVVEYIQLIEWAQWRLSLERMAGLDGVQEALKEMVARVISAVGESAIMPSPKALLLPQDTVTRVLEEIRLHADAVREVIGDEIRRTFQVGSVVEYIQLIEWAQWRLSLERMAGLDGVQEALKEMVARVISAVGESAIMPSPKALLA
ncbi:hypothetical protein A1Q2_01576 [Trichosporon asahii var. asahii CBS 8904]|uniref:Uncharacterized protein n=1 Tax=Trichosporon asahii var. asahii (strain CBS 8904) TaxID=1220162 RepID=K1VUC8_TRIAC|nr:hypothetical protein A1Q2_01576 [Trichosporon asahii var. asahii CBS 8904]